MRAYVAVGANIGPCQKTIEKAIHYLNAIEGVRVTRVSPLYKTSPVGPIRQPDFLNGVFAVETKFKPAELLSVLLMTEKKFGRRRMKKWGPRTIDLDLLTVGSRRLKTPKLTLPHPRYHERAFVLVPFTAIAPRFVHPVLKQQNRALLRKLTLPGQRVTIHAQWNGKQYRPSKSKRKTKSPS